MTTIPEHIMQAADRIVPDNRLIPSWSVPGLREAIARAIMAAVEAEREACARVAEKRHEHWQMPHPDDAKPGEVCCDVTACADIATAIRGQS